MDKIAVFFIGKDINVEDNINIIRINVPLNKQISLKVYHLWNRFLGS